jgi:hypothetical protein
VTATSSDNGAPATHVWRVASEIQWATCPAGRLIVINGQKTWIAGAPFQLITVPTR